jgi:hypothetical protein
MDKTQADVVADAILDPERRAQEEVRRRRARESALRARQRRVAWLGLVGAGVGVGIACYGGFRFPLGVIWSGAIGSLISWLIPRRAAG